MYYVMDFDTSFPKAAMIMHTPQIPGYPNLAFDDGVRIKGQLPVFDFIQNKDCQGVLTDYLWTTLRGLTVSERFKKTLDAAGVDNVDYYPVRIINEVTGEIRSDYYVGNVVGLLDCLNRAKSGVMTDPDAPGLITDIEQIVLDEDKIKGTLFFRLKDVSGIVLAHPRVQKAVTKAKLTGALFTPSKECSWP
jgi:hypothetical protein